MILLLFKLILAHLLGDFILQPKTWVKAKEKKKLKSFQLYLHAGLHGLLTLLLVGDLHFWIWAVVLAATHFAIDTIKLYLQRESTKRYYFFMDQLAHLLSIIVVWMVYTSIDFDPWTILEGHLLVLITLILFLTKPVSIIVRTFISKWTPEANGESDSLQEAGQYIGILERLFIFTFIVSGHWEAIGFLIAAKSVFRFGDLRQSKDRKLTEYVLIGTLLSFGLAILTGLVYVRLDSM